MSRLLSAVYPAIARMNQLGAQGKSFLFVIDFEMGAPVIELLPLSGNQILFDINGYSHVPDRFVQPVEITFSKEPVAFETYKIAFEKVMEQIHDGNSYLLNLTQPSFVETSLTLKEIFYFSQAKYKLYFKDQFVVFSPETFITISEGIISAYPMKGTIDASIPQAESVILTDSKEKAEHMTIVDLIRNDLSIFAKKVQVKRLRYLDYITTNHRNLWQVSSEITGHLPINYRKQIGDILFSLLPAGSVTGAPKQQTLEIIKAAEKYRRGYYTGVFGYFDGTNLDSGVMIRYIEKEGSRMIYKSGGGITSKSNLNREYQELIDKIYVPFN